MLVCDTERERANEGRYLALSRSSQEEVGIEALHIRLTGDKLDYYGSNLWLIGAAGSGDGFTQDMTERVILLGWKCGQEYVYASKEDSPG